MNKLSLLPLGAIGIGVLCIQFYQFYWLFYLSMASYLVYLYYEEQISSWVKTNLILQYPTDCNSLPSRVQHDERRQKTYPSYYPNTWYHFLDSDELKIGEVREVRALNQTFVLWRKSDGTPVCQDAYCLHLGANLGVGGHVVDDCIQCPFHLWKFDSNGAVKEIPYLEDPHKCPTHAKLKTYPCRDYGSWVVVYFHADGKDPEFEMPEYILQQVKEGGFIPHLKWNVGHVPLNVIDLVDQAADHTHFNTFHGEMYIPWTLIRFPQWFQAMFPIGILHKVTTFMGDEKEWAARVKETGFGEIGQQLLYFYDDAGITWKKKILPDTLARTTEMYAGPALVIFHIPFRLGTIKVFLSFLPTEGGSIVRLRTWIDRAVQNSYFIKSIAWLLAGISASQLMTDIVVMSNKIRLRKPMIQPFDGPYNRVNAWMKQFYSEGTSKISPEAPYKNDW